MKRESTPHDHAVKPPRYCPTCRQDLSQYPYYRLRPSPFARKLLTLARLLIPVMTVVFLIQFFSDSFPQSFGIVSGYLIVAYICTPSLLIYAVTLLIPRVRRVTCLHCSWYHDYPFRWGLFEARS